MHRSASSLTLTLMTLILSLRAAADVISPAPESVQVTIYRDPDVDLYAPLDEQDYEQTLTGLAMITETRRIQVPAGTSTIIFRGVADAIVPQTAAIDGLDAVVLESNFDYDLLSPGTLISKSLGRSVRLVRTDEATGRVTERHAIIRSGPQGVVLDIDGKLEALGCSGFAEKLVFDSVPEGLAEEPTLSMRIRAERTGQHTIQLSYLALGLNWAADYVATINLDGRTLNLTGWITLVNRAATTFANAPTEVVAGELARTPEETQPPGANQEVQTPNCWPFGSFASRVIDGIVAQDIGAFPAYAAPQFKRSLALEETVVTGMRQSLDAKLSELGDYKLYSLPAPTTVAARQSKQVRFLNQADVPFERLYTYRLNVEELEEFDPERQAPIAMLRLQNKKRDGLGKPLPSGTISVLETSESRGPILAGEKKLQDTPVGLPVEIELGGAIDVWVEPTIVADETVQSESGREQQAKVEVRLGNDKPVAVLIEYRHPAEEAVRIVDESQQHTTKLGDPMWTFRLAPGARASLQYTLRKPE